MNLNDIFGKNLVSRFSGENGPKCGGFLWKIYAQNFSNFLQKVTIARKLKLDLIETFWENSKKVCESKGAWTRPKIRFFR